jgi:hypothetical protein
MHRLAVLNGVPIAVSLPTAVDTDREWVGETTPTDPRAQRNRAGRRGGHLLTRAPSPPCKDRPAHPASPAPLSRTVAPYANRATPTRASSQRNRQRRHLHTGYKSDRVDQCRLRKVTRNRGQFPTEQAALKVLYLAVRNLDEYRRPVGTRSSGWKQALQAFTIYFEGRIPTP